MTKHSIKDVANTAVLLSPTLTHSGVDIVIQNQSTDDVFIGASTVTLSSYGFKIASGSAISLRLGGKDEIYGIANVSVPVQVSVLTVGLA